MRVYCYRNLVRKGVVWSVKSTKSGLVVDRATTVYIKNGELTVSEAGRQRVLKNKRKNVHAGVRGKRVTRTPPRRQWTRLQYNPYLYDKFVDAEGKKALSAEYVKLTKTGCWATGITYVR